MSSAALQAAGCAQHELLGRALASFDRETTEALLTLVLAERRAAAPPHLKLVWTGPEAPTATSRDTAVVVRELFHQARASVLVAGFRFDHGEEILKPLHQAMVERNVTATMFVDMPRAKQDQREGPEFINAFLEDFVRNNWTFGEPLPAIYCDARQTQPAGRYVSLHAKCVVVDRRFTLVTSANFTDRGQTRNIELGAWIEDESFAAQVTEQWWSLVHERHATLVTCSR